MQNANKEIQRMKTKVHACSFLVVDGVQSAKKYSYLDMLCLLQYSASIILVRACLLLFSPADLPRVAQVAKRWGDHVCACVASPLAAIARSGKCCTDGVIMQPFLSDAVVPVGCWETTGYLCGNIADGSFVFTQTPTLLSV